jgi:hypothetical protein
MRPLNENELREARKRLHEILMAEAKKVSAVNRAAQGAPGFRWHYLRCPLCNAGGAYGYTSERSLVRHFDDCVVIDHPTV